MKQLSAEIRKVQIKKWQHVRSFTWPPKEGKTRKNPSRANRKNCERPASGLRCGFDLRWEQLERSTRSILAVFIPQHRNLQKNRMHHSMSHGAYLKHGAREDLVQKTLFLLTMWVGALCSDAGGCIPTISQADYFARPRRVKEPSTRQ